jgi:DNA repair exonuclease SbcCD ATPase subunit
MDWQASRPRPPTVLVRRCGGVIGALRQRGGDLDEQAMAEAHEGRADRGDALVEALRDQLEQRRADVEDAEAARAMQATSTAAAEAREKEAVARAAAFERRAGEAEQRVEQLAGDAEQRSVQIAALERRANEAEQARAALDSKVSPRREGVYQQRTFVGAYALTDGSGVGVQLGQMKIALEEGEERRLEALAARKVAEAGKIALEVCTDAGPHSHLWSRR